jgi:hypothetical protein
VGAAAPDGGTGTRPALEILGAHATDGVKLPLSAAALNHTLQIQSTSDMAVESLRIIVTPLRDAEGQLWTVSWTVNGSAPETQVPVAGFGSVALQLTATLPMTGAYKGDIFLVYAGMQSRTRLTVTRGPTPLPVEVLGLGLRPVESNRESLALQGQRRHRAFDPEGDLGPVPQTVRPGGGGHDTDGQEQGSVPGLRQAEERLAH